MVMLSSAVGCNPEIAGRLSRRSRDACIALPPTRQLIFFSLFIPVRLVAIQWRILFYSIQHSMCMRGKLLVVSNWSINGPFFIIICANMWEMCKYVNICKYVCNANNMLLYGWFGVKIDGGTTAEKVWLDHLGPKRANKGALLDFISHLDFCSS